jgi:hypothetical protein
MARRTWQLGTALGVVLCVAAVELAGAQYPPPPPAPAPWPWPYPPPGWGGGFGPGNVLNGQANVIDAQGNLMISQEQARIDREKANQAKLDTKKQTLDWKNYERANTWTFTDEQNRNQSYLLRRMLTNPVDAEITSGRSLNVIMPYLRQIADHGTQGPPVRLFLGQLRDINVTVGNAPSVGLFRNPGPLPWPLSLRGPAQQKLDAQLTTLASQARQGQVDPELFTQVQKGIEGLRQDLKDKYIKESGVDVGAWVSGNSFLRDLSTSVRALGQPNASTLLTGAGATGNTVDELVMNMTNQGMRFAPASPGREAGYFALQSAFTTFAAGSQNGSGFGLQVAPSKLPTAVRAPK